MNIDCVSTEERRLLFQIIRFEPGKQIPAHKSVILSLLSDYYGKVVNPDVFR